MGTANPTKVAVGGYGNLMATNEVPVDMSGRLWSSFPALTPLISITGRMENSGTQNVRVDWIEKNEIPTEVTVASNITAGATALAVTANGQTLVRDTLLFNPRTFDIARVSNTTNPTGNSITIVRDEGGTTGAAWVAGDRVHVFLPALNEDDENMRNVSVANDNVYNLVQLCKLQLAITRTNNRVGTYFGGPGNKREELQGQKYREYRIKKEKLVMFGGRAQSGTGSTVRRTAMGIVQYLRNGTLYKDFGGVFTETGFDNWLGDYRDQNPDVQNAMLFCAPNVKRQIGYMLKGRIRLSPMSKEYGMDIMRYVDGPLAINFVELPLLTDPVTKGWGFLLDMERIAMRTLDADTLYLDAKSVGESEIIYDTYRGLHSIMLANESRHAMMVGATI
jgi:hypothetical protein